MGLFKSKLVIAALIFAFILVSAHWLSDEAMMWLAYTPDALSNGEWWRLWTGHFVHFTRYHAVMNGVGLVLVSIGLLHQQSLRFFMAIHLVLPLFISLGFYFFDSSIDQYRGYSGVIHGLIALGLILEWRHHKLLSVFAFLLLMAKIIYEHLPMYDVNYLQHEIGVPVSIEAHLLGFIGGTVMGLAVLVLRHSK
jgi:rhomboid family GlyGly-CTERM serine protease